MGKRGKVLFYGPLGVEKKFIVGGGETGNLRTIHLLKKNKLEVITLQKPYPEKNVVGYFIYSFRMIIKIFSFLNKMMNSQIKTVHISGYYLHLIYHEFLLVLISKLFKIKCIYELRGGGVMEAYDQRSSFYKFIFKSTVNNASVILCQGKSYIKFLKTITSVPVLHYPNFILNDFLSDNFLSDREKSEVIELVYFGRITQSKNIDLIIMICKELYLKNEKFNLELIGSGEDKYITYLNGLIDEYNLTKFIRITSPVEHKILQYKLAHKHFFLFPSNEKREGHSNALTEAMSAGIVPVSSNAGFNAEIVSDKKLVINNFDPINYSKVIRSIWHDGKWQYYSNKVALRIKNHYTEKIAQEIILKAYDF
jgi:glycosyltransferase involved in cell wall biosynthesis